MKSSGTISDICGDNPIAMQPASSMEEREEFLSLLKSRFEKNMNRHSGIKWQDVSDKLHKHPDKLEVLVRMEASGGEPDVVGVEKNTGAFLFFDCATESPAGRRSFCYDRAALDARKENKPKNNALEAAAEIGIEILNEEQYRYLQTLGKFDTKTSSWVLTPPEIRKHGGAIFCDRRYEHVFTYHNGAESYYAARGFRGCLKV